MVDVKELTDIELMKAYWDAVESQIGYRIKRYKDEMNRRNKEE